MKLPILKELKYISPSSFQRWEKCNYATYLLRLSGLPWPEQETATNAALGTVFDAGVKSALCSANNWSIDREALWSGLRIKVLQENVITDGLELANQYARLCHKMPLVKRITRVDLQAPEECIHNGIPIFGYPDAITDTVPLDWKTSGYHAKYSVSAKAGHSGVWNLLTGERIKAAHPKNSEPFENIDRNWAIQGLFYSWMMDAPVPGMIVHQIIFQKKRKLLVIYEGSFSDEFIREIEEKLARMWEQCGGSSWTGIEPIPGEFQCKWYGQWCQACLHCEPFTRWSNSITTKPKEPDTVYHGTR